MMTADTAAPRLSASARLVAGALAETHETTVVALTAAAGVSKSTVAKTLTLLERAAAAQRTVRETDDGAREADLWSPGPGLGGLLFTTAVEDGYGHALGHQQPKPTSAPAERPDHERVEECDAITLADAGIAPVCESPALEAADAACGDIPAAQQEAAHSDAHTPAAAATPVSGPSGRLAPGGLAEMVTAVLVAHPDLEYTPTQLSHLLNGRSSGAIANALEKMIKTGSVVRTCDKPKRYRRAV